MPYTHSVINNSELNSPFEFSLSPLPLSIHTEFRVADEKKVAFQGSEQGSTV